jgi:hypothetical protein
LKSMAVLELGSVGGAAAMTVANVGTMPAAAAAAAAEDDPPPLMERW